MDQSVLVTIMADVADSFSTILKELSSVCKRTAQKLRQVENNRVVGHSTPDNQDELEAHSRQPEIYQSQLTDDSSSRSNNHDGDEWNSTDSYQLKICGTDSDYYKYGSD